jgi:hypothetical protein
MQTNISSITHIFTPELQESFFAVIDGFPPPILLLSQNNEDVLLPENDSLVLEQLLFFHNTSLKNDGEGGKMGMNFAFVNKHTVRSPRGPLVIEKEQINFG